METTLDKSEALKTLEIDIKACKKCKLCYTRESPTVSRGNPRSPLMIVSDFPREGDQKAGETLKGRAGKKLDNMLIKAGLQPDMVYITSLIKCFPGRMGYFPEDDSPGRCYPYLKQQISIIKPLVVVLLGPEATAWVLTRGTEESNIASVNKVDKMFRRRDVYEELRFFVLPHPVSLLGEKDEPMEEACIKAFTLAKGFIAARQKGEPIPDIEIIDVKKMIIRDKKEQTEMFKWKKPDPPENSEPQNA